MNQRQQGSTAHPVTFFLTDESDHISGLTGLTPTVTLSKNGGSFAAAEGTVSEIGNGWYALAGDADDRDTLGELLVHATDTGADPFDGRYVIVPWDPFDANLDLTNLDAPVSSTAIPGDAMTLTSGERDDVAAALLDLANAIETGLTLRQAMRLVAAALAGKLAGAATTEITIRNAIADSKDRIVATVDEDGNRSAVTTDVS